MTSSTFFFTNIRLGLIYMAFGYVFIFAGSYWLRETVYSIPAVIASAFFLVLALFFVMRDDKKDEQVQRL